MFGSSINTCAVAKNLVIISQAEKRRLLTHRVNGIYVSLSPLFKFSSIFHYLDQTLGNMC